jgi:hypothetical protein
MTKSKLIKPQVSTVDTVLEDLIHPEVDGQYVLCRIVDSKQRYLHRINLTQCNTSIKGFTECLDIKDALVLQSYPVTEAVRMYLNHVEAGFDVDFQTLLFKV